MSCLNEEVDSKCLCAGHMRRLAQNVYVQTILTNQLKVSMSIHISQSNPNVYVLVILANQLKMSMCWSYQPINSKHLCGDHIRKSTENVHVLITPGK